MATATKASAAQRRLAKKYKANPPSGKYIGPEGNKGRLPKGYKGPEKGKYYGPDKYRGNASKYNARNGGAAATPAPANAEAPAATETPTDPITDAVNQQQQPQIPGQQNAYDPNATVSNSSGLINLQTTHDLNMQELEAQDAHDQEILAANQEESASLIEEEQANNALGEQRIGDRGSLNKTLAYRGMGRGSTAIQKSTAMGNQHLSQANQIAARRKLAKDAVAARKTAAGTTLGERKKAIALARTKYTVDESEKNPTAGSQAEDSGVNPIDVPDVTPQASAPVPETLTETAAAPAEAPAAAPDQWKGKYRGPDLLGGDAKRLAAWRKAGRPKVTKKNAHKF